jgi:dnd system-associated protein 4
MTTKATATKRDRVFVEKGQIDTYREMAGIGGTRRKKTEGADMPPFEDLKDVFLMAACLGVQTGHPTPLRDKQELARTSYFNEHIDSAVLRAIAIAETGGVEVLADKNEVFKIAEEYANTGFTELGRRVLGPGRPLVNLTSFLLEEYEHLFPTSRSEENQSEFDDDQTEHNES